MCALWIRVCRASLFWSLTHALVSRFRLQAATAQKNAKEDKKKQAEKEKKLVQKERKRLRAAVLVVRERGTLRSSPEQVDGLCLALDLAALKALADTLEPADVPLEVCAAALTAALEATGGGSLDDTRMSWAQRQAQQRMLAAQLQEVAAAEASERQAAVAAAKLLREEREAAAAATKLLRVGPQTVNFKHPFQTPVRFFKDRIEIPAVFRTVLKSLLDFKKPVEIPLQVERRQVERQAEAERERVEQVRRTSTPSARAYSPPYTAVSGSTTEAELEPSRNMPAALVPWHTWHTCASPSSRGL